MKDINIVITREEIDKDDIALFSQYKNISKINLIALPTIITIPINSINISNAIKKIENGFYDYYIFASSRSVNIFFEKIKKEKDISRIMQNLIKLNENNANCFIAIGPKTKKEIEKNKIKAILAINGSFSQSIRNINDNNNIPLVLDNIKTDYSINNIMEILEKLDKDNEKKEQKAKILMPRSLESLSSHNFIIKKYKNLILDQVFFYETREFDRVKESNEWKKFQNIVSNKNKISIIFTSPSTVRSFFRILANNFFTEKNQYELESIPNAKNDQELLSNLGIRKIISLGPKTSEELKKRNLTYSQPKEHTIKGALYHILKFIDQEP
ncbi:MAG: uroporphyrinogen-III synthase [Candidatus Nitrosocosmicus sp.]